MILLEEESYQFVNIVGRLTAYTLPRNVTKRGPYYEANNHSVSE